MANKDNSTQYFVSEFSRIVDGNSTSKGRDREKLLEEYKAIFKVLDTNIFSFHFIFDFTTFRYIMFSKSVSNFGNITSEDILNDPQIAFDTFHPSDQIKLKYLHKKLFAYFYQTPIEERKALKFNFNYRARKDEKTWVHILQQSVFILLSEEGHPVHDFSTCTDISSHKKDNKLELAIFKLDQNNVYQQVYEYKLEEDQLKEIYNLSERELEVICLAAEGITASEISDKLFLSVHTVNNHKKNILKKTNSKSFTEVINKTLN